MSSNTPSSLLWLIRKQTRLAGQMQRRTEELGRVKAHVAEIEAEIADLAEKRSQIEAVMKLHDVQVDPRDLRPIRPHARKALIGHGGITRVVMAELREAPDNMATTVELAAAVVRYLDSVPEPEEMSRLKRRVRIRLAIMASKGKLVAVPALGHSTPNSWRLATAPSVSPSGSPVADPGGGDV